MCTLKDKLVECGACVAAVILVLAVCYGLGCPTTAYGICVGIQKGN